MSFYSGRHRTICAVLEEMRAELPRLYKFIGSEPADDKMNALIDEAQDYARRMSAKLTEYKRREDGNSVV